MARLRRVRLLSAIVIAPLLAFAVGASSYLALRCSMTGRLVAESCCPRATDAGGGDSAFPHASTTDAACCESFVVSMGKVPATTCERMLDRPMWSVTALATPSPASSDLCLRSWRGCALRTARPPGIAPPAFLLTHSFLI
jgi:hypothetical protein